MPTYDEDLAKVQEKRKQSGQLSQEYANLASGAETFSDRVMKIVRDNRATRGASQLAQGQGQVMSQLVSSGAESRERLADVNPLQTDVITARERAGLLGTASTLAQQEADISGTIQETIGAGANQLKAMALLKQAEAEKAADEADEMMAVLEFRSRREQEKFENTIAEREIALAERKGSGGGDGLTPGQTLEYDQLKRTAKGAVLQGINDGIITSDDDIRMSLYSAGVDPDDKFFSDLYGKIGGSAEEVTSGWKLSDVASGASNWLKNTLGGVKTNPLYDALLRK